MGEAVNRDDNLYAPQILGIAACTRLRHRWCIRCHWCLRELGAADRMGGRCRDCRAVVRRAGLAMVTFAGASPRGDTGRRGTSILAAGGWSNCCLRHASAEDWTALKRRTREQRFGALYGNLARLTLARLSSAWLQPRNVRLRFCGPRSLTEGCDLLRARRRRLDRLTASEPVKFGLVGLSIPCIVGRGMRNSYGCLLIGADRRWGST
jgi:hypothetical protein